MEIINADSLIYLNEKEDNSIENFLTGIPDMNEVNMDFDDYLVFFRKTCKLIFEKLSKNGYAIFVQTDRKINKQWFDKSYYLTDVAYSCKCKLLWHKIILQREVGKVHLQRPTYSHILCYSYNRGPGVGFEDVFPIGNKIYENATPENIAFRLAQFIKDQKGTYVMDPFVGQGTIGKAVMAHSLKFTGIDIDKSQCELSEKLLSINPLDPKLKLKLKIKNS